MKQSTRAVAFATIISIMTEVIEGKVYHYDEMDDLLTMVGLDSEEVLNLPPLLAFHKVCREFAKMEITEQDLDEIAKGDLDE